LLVDLFESMMMHDLQTLNIFILSDVIHSEFMNF